ncbi:cytidylate kinase [Slackia heliotrinireducens]|uniref:cytidylate kinase family protein n=1 Tax=Slackia heliotrinireducens TaxID=84110 RepID=UPI000F704E59|nr:cytidylate kinase family protein [Slackia heliotrinireducens]VEH02079.1 cytidylate kinase [Slackia heliotrinireducens]
MGWAERIRRYAVLLFGIFAISFGVALITKSAIGNSAISAIPYTMSFLVPQLTYGMHVALFNALLVLLQIILLRRDCQVFDICQQVVFAAVFGSVVDFSMWLLTWYDPQSYPLCACTMLLGVVCLAFGAYLEVIGRVGMMAGDGLARALVKVTGKEFGTMRVAADSTMVLIAVVMNLLYFRSLVTVREGTIVAALLTGLVVTFFSRHLTAFEYAVLPENRNGGKASNIAVPEGNFIVTVSREYGSGGREVGHAIADALGVQCYDSRLIHMMAAQSGLPEDYVAGEGADGSGALAAFYTLYAGAVAEQDMPKAERLFKAEEQVIRRLAAQESCVIVGRLAEYVLRDHANVLRIFLRADKEDAVARVMDREGLSRSEAEAKIDRVNRERADHCLRFAHTAWGMSGNYDVTMNTSRYGVVRTGEMLAAMARSAREGANGPSRR